MLSTHAVSDSVGDFDWLFYFLLSVRWSIRFCVQQKFNRRTAKEKKRRDKKKEQTAKVGL